jgi:Asp/Glu/hydantoin racemase
MRLLIINPNTNAEMTAAIHRAAVAAAGPDVQVETVQAKAGPRSIEGHFDEAASMLAARPSRPLPSTATSSPASAPTRPSTPPAN